MLATPPGYTRKGPPRKPKIEPFTGVIDAILEADRRAPRKQRHTAKRIFERLRDEYGFEGQQSIVKDYVREHRRRVGEMFVPLSHGPGHAQCDFGEALAVIAGVERKVHYFVLDLPHSDGCFAKAYPGETTEAFLDGHVSAFAFLGGVPQSVLYDNTKLAVAKILGDGRRKRTRAFSELQSHYLFEDRFGRPGKGNDKGKVEGMVCRWSTIRSVVNWSATMSVYEGLDIEPARTDETSRAQLSIGTPATGSPGCRDPGGE